MSRAEIENLVATCFSRCPFCFSGTRMRFEWGRSIPKRMTCANCGAEWELLFGLNTHRNRNWRFLGAKLVGPGSTEKGTHLLERMYGAEFWGAIVVSGTPEKPPTLETERIGVAERTVIIREIVKIRCPYCGALYDEIKDKCPHCGGKR